MQKTFTILFCLLLFFVGCKTHTVKLENSLDPDIVLVNIGEGDRAFIGKVLLKLDSLNPMVVGVNVLFQGQTKRDSALIAAFNKLKNDILIYSVKKDGQVNGSDSVFTNLTDQGNLYYEQRMNLVTTVVPLQKVNDRVHESFAYKIIRHWKPDSLSEIRIGEKIDIQYTRNLDKFPVIDGSLLLNTHISDFHLPNKVFLVGYVGPADADKYFTPLRNLQGDYKPNEPDTYGLVIIANQVRTILRHKSQ